MGPFFYTIVVCSSYCNRIPHSLNTHKKNEQTPAQFPGTHCAFKHACVTKENVTEILA